MFTVDMDGDGILDSEDDGTGPADVIAKESGVGSSLREAIEAETGTQITCGHCIAYLNALNLDVDAVTEGLLRQLALPPEFRSQLGGIAEQRAWLRAIVYHVINKTSKE
jgi:hypothetical protein